MKADEARKISKLHNVDLENSEVLTILASIKRAAEKGKREISIENYQLEYSKETIFKTLKYLGYNIESDYRTIVYW